jgi:hypothetical protein
MSGRRYVRWPLGGAVTKAATESDPLPDRQPELAEVLVAQLVKLIGGDPVLAERLDAASKPYRSKPFFQWRAPMSRRLRPAKNRARY